jgi:hypothetical protein
MKHGARTGREGSARLASPRTRVKPENRLRSRFDPDGVVAARSRSRSILLRLRNRPPSQGTDQPFLLVFRTRHVVTLDTASDGKSSAGYTGFSSIWPDAHRTITGAGGNETPETAARCPFQACHLRTVIVTAAVYRGLDSRLRPKANLSS